MSFLVALVWMSIHAGVGDFSDVVLGDNGEVDFDTVLIPGTALVNRQGFGSLRGHLNRS